MKAYKLDLEKIIIEGQEYPLVDLIANLLLAKQEGGRAYLKTIQLIERMEACDGTTLLLTAEERDQIQGVFLNIPKVSTANGMLPCVVLRKTDAAAVRRVLEEIEEVDVNEATPQ